MLTLPATTVEAERSFSCMERVKTWLRLAMASDHLSELCVLHCYQERVDEKSSGADVKLEVGNACLQIKSWQLNRKFKPQCLAMQIFQWTELSAAHS